MPCPSEWLEKERALQLGAGERILACDIAN